MISGISGRSIDRYNAADVEEGAELTQYAIIVADVSEGMHGPTVSSCGRGSAV